jgi:hypothetical protein
MGRHSQLFFRLAYGLEKPLENGSDGWRDVERRVLMYCDHMCYPLLAIGRDRRVAHEASERSSGPSTSCGLWGIGTMLALDLAGDSAA